MQDALYFANPITNINGILTPFWSFENHKDAELITRGLEGNTLHRYNAETKSSEVVNTPTWDLPSDPSPAEAVPSAM